eukprot:gene5768-6471_t
MEDLTKFTNLTNFISTGSDDTPVKWCFSQVKGTVEEDITEADLISTVEFNHNGELLATGDKGGRIPKGSPHYGDYNVYSTFQSHEPDFDYLKSLDIDEKINQMKWLKRRNAAHFLLSTNDKTVKLWKISERNVRIDGPLNTKNTDGSQDLDPKDVCSLKIPKLQPTSLMIEASPRKIFSNAHTYHINSISINSDDETYLSADDLRINLWHMQRTDQSFIFEEQEDPLTRSFFSEIISSIADVKFSHSGKYMLTRDYLTVKIWDLAMEKQPVETYPVHEYLRSKLCALYENDCIFDKFECAWSCDDSEILTGSYNNFFRIFNREQKSALCLEATRENMRPRQPLKSKKITTSGKRKKDEISVECLDFSKKILHIAWHPLDNIVALAATNNLYLFQEK